jgi:hypothetical protein
MTSGPWLEHARAGDEGTAELPPGKFEPDAGEPHAAERRMNKVAHELAATAKRHGKDSVALQAGLLIHSLAAGAVGVTEVAVVGESPHAGPQFLEVDVTTGIIFDAEASTPSAQLTHIWQRIAAPTLKNMNSFETTPRGIELVFRYGLQRFADRPEHKPDPLAPAEMRILRLAIPEAALAELTARAIEVDAVLPRATIDDGTRVIPLDELGIR